MGMINIFNLLDILSGLIMFTPFSILFYPLAVIYLVKGLVSTVPSISSFGMVTFLGAIDLAAALTFFMLSHSKEPLWLMPVAIALMAKGVIFFFMQN